MPATYPSGSNTFVKNHEASGNMVISYSRNIDDFAVNQVTQIKPVQKESGYYLQFTAEQAARLLNSDAISEFVWADGQERPLRNEGTESFQFLEYKTIRTEFGANLGNKSVDQADFDILGIHGAIHGQQAMTARTQRVYTCLTDTSNYDSGHYSAVASITGNTGNWGQSTTQRQDVRRSLNYALGVIKKATLGVVKQKDLHLVIGPATAMELAETQEIVDHVKHSPEAWAQVRGDIKGINTEWGLPDQLYGYPVVVDDTVRVSSKKGATRSADFVWQSGYAALVSRPGALVNEGGGGPSFSSITNFVYEELSVETLRDDRNRRVQLSVVLDEVPVLTAPAATFLFTSAV